VVLMWVPPLIDELSGHPGNLTLLVRFFRSGSSTHHSLREAVATTGQMLAGAVHGNLPVVAAIQPELTRRRLLVVAGFAAAAAALCAAGRLRRDRFAEATGGLLLVALGVAVLSITRITGEIEGYDVVWVTALVAVLALGWASLLAGALPDLARLVTHRPAAALAAAAVPAVALLGLLSTTRAEAFLDLPTPGAEPGDLQIGYATAWRLTAAGLEGVPRQPVLVRIATHELWGTAAALTVQLVKQGWPVHVTDDWVFYFGDEFRPTGRERVELVLAEPPDAAAIAGRRIGTVARTVLILRTGS
jgi:hypothetical protein